MARVKSPRSGSKPGYRSSSTRTARAGEYERWTALGADALRQGEFRRSFEAYSKAKQSARQSGDSLAADKAGLNLSMVLIQMGEARQGEEGLREILLRTTDPRLAYTAAYHLAASLRKQGRHERALSYARRAMENAQALDLPELRAPAHNLLGNIFLSQNYMDEALKEYGRALALCECQPGDSRYLEAILEENAGYCLLLKQRFEEGIAKINRALQLANEVGDRRCRAECHQDLCYGLLLQGRHSSALAMGEAALNESRTGGYADIEENCHYLLGELGTQTGDLVLRDLHFDLLQAMHPEIPFLKDFLCAVDVTSIITLKR